MIIQLNNVVNITLWEEFFKRNQFANIFQSIEFYNFFNSLPNQESFVFAVLENENILALMVVTLQKEKGFKGYFSRRAICYGGPLVEENNTEALTFLLRKVKKFLNNKAIYLEVRNSNDYSFFNEMFLDEGFSFIPYLNVKLSLDGKDLQGVIKKMKYNRRREIRLSQERKADLRLAEDSFEVKRLYSILESLYRSKVKLPLPSLDYFIQLFNSEFGRVFIAIHENNIIGGAFCLFDQNTIYTIYYCGLKNYQKKIYPTHLAILGVIDFAISNNIKYVDFIGAGKKDKEYGVRKYKMEFGGDLVEHGRFINLLNPFLYKIGLFGLKILSRVSR